MNALKGPDADLEMTVGNIFEKVAHEVDPKRLPKVELRYVIPVQVAEANLPKQGFSWSITVPLSIVRYDPRACCLGAGTQVAVDDLIYRSIQGDPPLLEQDGPSTKRLYGPHVVADEEDGAAVAADLVHLAQAFLLESRISDREHLVDDKDFGLEVGSDGESQPHVHAARVALDGRVEELLDLGEVDDLVKLPGDLPPRHAQDRAVEIDVLAARQLGMKAGADLEQTADPSVETDLAPGRLGDPAQDLQQSRLAGAVAADDPDDLPWLDIEGNIIEGSEIIGVAISTGGAVQGFPDVRVGLKARLTLCTELVKPSVIDSRRVR